MSEPRKPNLTDWGRMVRILRDTFSHAYIPEGDVSMSDFTDGKLHVNPNTYVELDAHDMALLAAIVSTPEAE